jgi:hypothetical protein
MTDLMRNYVGQICSRKSIPNKNIAQADLIHKSPDATVATVELLDEVDVNNGLLPARIRWIVISVSRWSGRVNDWIRLASRLGELHRVILLQSPVLIQIVVNRLGQVPEEQR